MILDFNADWRFYKADGSCRTVHLPHDAMLEEPRQENCQNGKDCGYFPGGKYAYEKTFSLPGEHLNEALTFLFEGVYQNAVVYLNGEKNCRTPLRLYGIYRRCHRKSACRGKHPARHGG